ncbi:SDR family oxidoreductase [Heyndrickxia coagulans]|uniref:NAD-dependent epimerase/dehydratase family protein n=1 Tax=Heyndrickxia coagulans TaxID=1398 RepID=UPI000D726F53|nr:SDR family oxidoreductase [Heyndrickxia coagulans]AWP35946.1 NAD-dependent epimerase/dehydratase [Heyndrickxia coagulans]QDI61444.1 SDR family oxidoreductase [Heyndrickxia coagulans]
MKIAITGGTGFLGRYLEEKLLKYKHEPVILTRKVIIDNNIEYRFTDYSITDLIDNLADIDAVVHLAAKRGSQGRISEFHDNEVLTQNLYEACLKNEIRNIIYASSISVYSDETLLPWTEKHPPMPKLMYGVSKMACEYIGNIYSGRYGLKIKNLRFAHIYGFNEKNNYMINKFFRQAFNKKTLVLDSKSISKREFLYAKDAAKAILCALNTPEASGNYNIGSGEALTNLEVAKKINSIFKNEGNLLIKDQSASESIKSSYMESRKALNILNFKADYSFSSSLQEIYDSMKELDHVPILY